MKAFRPVIKSIDYNLLHSQRGALLEVLDCLATQKGNAVDEDAAKQVQEYIDPLNGIWELLSALQDAAEKAGLFKYTTQQKEN